MENCEEKYEQIIAYSDKQRELVQEVESGYLNWDTGNLSDIKHAILLGEEFLTLSGGQCPH